ncbi:hypothetical protein NXV73_07075 [Bacteroides salyersiae]|nr:hypothetical protein [Bacteroides salyersiae]
MDAFSSFATLYNMDGTIADSFAKYRRRGNQKCYPADECRK